MKDEQEEASLLGWISVKTVGLECPRWLDPQLESSEIKLSGALVPSQSLLLGLQMAAFSGCLLVVSSTYVCALISSSSEGTSPSELGPP